MANQLECKIWVKSDCSSSYAAKDMTAAVTNFGTLGNLNGDWSWSDSIATINNGTTVLLLYTVSGLPTGWKIIPQAIVKTNSCGQVCGFQTESCTGAGEVSCANADDITSAMTITRDDNTHFRILDNDPSTQANDKTYHYAIAVTNDTDVRFSDPSILNKGSGSPGTVQGVMNLLPR